MLDPRAIALQGIGFAVAVVALQGFAPSQVDAQTSAPASYYGSGRHEDDDLIRQVHDKWDVIEAARRKVEAPSSPKQDHPGASTRSHDTPIEAAASVLLPATPTADKPKPLSSDPGGTLPDLTALWRRQDEEAFILALLASEF